MVDSQVDQWRFLHKLFLEDSIAGAEHRAIDRQRQVVRSQVLQLLSSFLDQRISAELFTATLQKARDAWSIIGLRGLSTSMFLCRLIKCVSDTASITRYLRTYLPVPDNDDLMFGQIKMQQLTSEIEELILSGQTTRYYIQPARVPFFLSVWWHIQSPAKWPVFYPSARPAFMSKTEEILEDSVEQYFTFYRRFNSIADELGISLWELEHICTWYDQHRADTSHPCYQITELQDEAKKLCQNKTKVELIPIQNEIDINEAPSRNMSSVPKIKRPASRHVHLQWLLAKIGLKVGYQVWISVETHEAVWNGERLGDLSLKSLPFSGDFVVEQSISHIDVLWLHKNEIVVAYEIEHDRKADVTTGLLRLSDLTACFPRRNLQLCVVAPQERLERIKSELPRPAFQKIKNLALLCEEALIKQHEHILRWANSPSIIQDLISHVGEESQSMTNALA